MQSHAQSSYRASTKCPIQLYKLLRLLPDRHVVLMIMDLVGNHSFNLTTGIRLPDVLERQGLSLNLLLKRIMSLILEKHLVVLDYFPASLKILEYF